MTKKQKLELTWIGKDNRPRLEPRILLEDPEKSYHAPHRVTDSDIFDNRLIFGDNLLALKALEQEFTGKVKCVFIDPPYNTGNAFEHYDDRVEHSLWLSLMRDRVEILHNLLSKDGFFCCHIDDSEGHYLKVLLDEVFGRNNYLTTIYIQVRYASKTLKQDMDFHKQIEMIHVYRKEYGAKPCLNSKSSSFDKFSYYIKEKNEGERITLGGKRVEIFKKDDYEIIKAEGSENGLKEIWASGSILDGNSSGRFFRDYIEGRQKKDGLGILYKVYGIGDDNLPYRYFTGPKKDGATKGKYYQGVPKNQLEDTSKVMFSPIENFYNLAGNFGNCRGEGGVDFRSGKKPEILIHFILKHFSQRDDLVLDSFLGSGTTAAVAHKMGRRWIGIEQGEHCHTHCIPRLKKVIDGEDMGGITFTQKEKTATTLCKECKESLCEDCKEKVKQNTKPEQVWFGGGGFRYYRLAPSLLEKDKWGREVISKNYNATMLAEAVCKLENFTYAPSDTVYWQHGYSSERDFIYVTTQILGPEQLHQLSDDVGSGRSLLVLCAAFRDVPNSWPNLTIKKIPNYIKDRCEWGRDDYSLKIESLPQAPLTEVPSSSQTKKRGRRPANPDLFDSITGDENE